MHPAFGSSLTYLHLANLLLEEALVPSLAAGSGSVDVVGGGTFGALAASPSAAGAAGAAAAGSSLI